MSSQSYWFCLFFSQILFIYLSSFFFLSTDTDNSHSSLAREPPLDTIFATGLPLASSFWPQDSENNYKKQVNMVQLTKGKLFCQKFLIVHKIIIRGELDIFVLKIMEAIKLSSQ